MAYVYEIWDTIWNFVDSIFWVIPLLVGAYVTVHAVGDPYRRYKQHQKEQENIEIHYEFLGNPEGKEERNEQSLKRDMELRENKDEFKISLLVSINMSLILIGCLLFAFLIFWTIKNGYPF